MSNNTLGMIIIGGAIVIALLGGSKGASQNGLFSTGNQTPEQKQQNIQQKIVQTQAEVEALKKQVQAEEFKKTQSEYYGLVNLSYLNRSTDPSQEYIVIRVNNTATKTIPVTGWILRSTSSGETVAIPKATYLFFTNSLNTKDDIYLNKNDSLYLITGVSPNGESFKLNKCSGYLTQFQQFYPYINNNCPAGIDEDLSSIPKIVMNDACLDYINSLQVCRAETKNLPVTWGYDCTRFIYDKLNYSSCVNTHKGDKDFYQPEWRVYLGRSSRIWKDRREEIILYDNLGKIVSTLTY